MQGIALINPQVIGDIQEKAKCRTMSYYWENLTKKKTEISTSAQPTKEQVTLAVFTSEQVTLRSDTFSNAERFSYVVASTYYRAPFKECKGRD